MYVEARDGVVSGAIAVSDDEGQVGMEVGKVDGQGFIFPSLFSVSVSFSFMKLPLRIFKSATFVCTLSSLLLKPSFICHGGENHSVE